MGSPDEPAVVLVATIRDVGTVVRCFRDVWSAERNHTVLSVSHLGISIHGYLNEIPDKWLADARAAYDALVVDKFADLAELATHTNSKVSNGPLVPISGGSSG